MRHCPECRQPHALRRDVCPECWVVLAEGEPASRDRLSLVFETHVLFEADLLEGVFHDEGIPCVRVPNGVTLPTGLDLTCLRLYVRSDMATAASTLADEVLGRSPGR